MTMLNKQRVARRIARAWLGSASGISSDWTSALTIGAFAFVLVLLQYSVSEARLEHEERIGLLGG